MAADPFYPREKHTASKELEECEREIQEKSELYKKAWKSGKINKICPCWMASWKLKEQLTGWNAMYALCCNYCEREFETTQYTGPLTDYMREFRPVGRHWEAPGEPK